MKLKKEPTNTETLKMLLLGICSVSLSIWLIWIPIIGMSLLVIGIVLSVISILVFLTKLANKVLK